MSTIILFIILLILIILIAYNIISKKIFIKIDEKIIYINSKKLKKNIKNSIYDIDYKDNLLYIPDFRNNKIIVIGNNLVVKTIKTHAPHGIGVDNKKNIYSTEFVNSNRIRKFDKDGKEIFNWDNKIRSLLNGRRPYSVDTEDNGNVYIALDNLIIKVSEKGELIKKFDFSKSNYKEILPHGITLHENKLYVADRKNGKLLVFNTEGEYLNSFSSNIKSGFNPLSINIYENNYLLVANYKNSSLHIFDMKGKEIKVAGGKGENYGEWMFITNVIDDKKGNIYTVEEKSNRIQLIDFSFFLN